MKERIDNHRRRVDNYRRREDNYHIRVIFLEGETIIAEESIVMFNRMENIFQMVDNC